MTRTEAEEKAQRLADETGFDHAVRPGYSESSYTVHMLPEKRHRFALVTQKGDEQVFYCTDWDRIRPGHGPC